MTLTVYSKPQCPFCDRAKQYLYRNNIMFLEVDVSQDPDAIEYLRAQGHSTVPQVYYQGKLFVPGGWEGLSKMTADDIRSEIELRDALASETL